MKSWLPSKHVKTLLVTDYTTKNDENIDRQTGVSTPGKQSILANWWPGREVWGCDWAGVGRIALFDFQDEPTLKERKAAVAALKEFLATLRPDNIICLQSLSKGAKKLYDDSLDSSGGSGSTLCWDIFGAPGSIGGSRDKSACGGTFIDSPYGRVLGLPNPSNGDYVVLSSILQWLEWTRDNVPTVRVPAETTFSEPGEGQRAALKRLVAIAKQGKPITFDLETFSTEDLITCVGISDGVTTVSVPWDSFLPHGGSSVEHGLAKGPEGRLVRAVFKEASVVVGHNILGHDIPFLRRRGVAVPGRTFDTYLAHGVCMNQFRHGLQAVVSQFVPTGPWKTFHMEHAKQSGLDPAYDPRAWIQNPKELRGYNAEDSFKNSLIAEPLASRCGILLGDP